LTADEMAALASRLMRALQDGDFETTEACFQPDATWSMNGRVHGRFAEILPELKKAKAASGVHPHLEIRRLYSADFFTDQHVVRLEREGKPPAELAICVVVRVGGDGRVTQFEEYFDPTVLNV
jgi:ketosteroid isomerase-like protein